MIPANCKRLIEVDLPIKTVSEHARHEQNVKKGHLHSMHVWWATRPLTACRAVLLGTLVPDPVDPSCPENFKRRAWELLRPLSAKSEANGANLRRSLLNFIGEFSAWENSTDSSMVNIARELIKASHSDGIPLVADPFAGIGSIPFEALRIGADSFASDLNPVATLLLKTALEYVPTYGERLAKEVRRWGTRVKKRAMQELHEFYPTEPDGSIPLAYIWARTIRCEGPGCGAEVPLVGLLWLSQREKVALRYHGDKKARKVVFEIFKPKSERDIQKSIVNRFTATCPVCNYTTPYPRVVEQLKKKHGGTLDAKMIAVITVKANGRRGYRLATEKDFEVAKRAVQRLEELRQKHAGSPPLVPEEPLPPQGSLGFRIQKYGMESWGDAFTSRQVLALSTFVKAIRYAHEEILRKTGDQDFAKAVTTCLSFAVSGTLAPYQSSLSFYSSDHMRSIFMQGMAIPMRPDFAEANPLMPDLVGGFDYALERVEQALKCQIVGSFKSGTVRQGPAAKIPLPDNSVPVIMTDRRPSPEDISL